jgi:hypothetical protein
MVGLQKITNPREVVGKNVKNKVMKILVNEEDLRYIEESIKNGIVVKEDLRRWFKEKWVDVSKKVDGKHPPCGRKDADGKSYPKCRPSKKVSKETPKTAGSYSKKEKKSMTSQKRRAEKKNPKIGKGNKPTMTKFDENMENTIKLDLSLIRESIQHPKLINENIEISNALKYHILSKKPLIENVYKLGTDSFFELLEESKQLYMNGELDLSDEDITFIYENEYGPIEETNYEVTNLLNEAEYQGRKVQLGKIMQGDIKKFKVYVKNEKGKVVKVNFGFGGKSAKGKRMVIKKNNPERRKSFRARHNCDNPGPRWKARYWACRTW